MRWLRCARWWVVAMVVACGDDGDGGGSSSTADASASEGTDPSTSSLSASTMATTSSGTSTGVDTSSESSAASSSDATSSDATSSDGSSGSTSGSTGLGDCRPLLAEVFYDAEGGDDLLQWVKLVNPCDAAIDLSTWSLGWAGTDYGPPRVKGLSGTIEASGCYVVGGPTSDASNGQPTYHYADDFAPGLDTAQEAGGGVALFDVAEGEVDATTIPIDAVVYGSDNANGLIDETGRPVAAPHVGSSGAGASIQRTSADATWTVAAPAPEECPAL